MENQAKKRITKIDYRGTSFYDSNNTEPISESQGNSVMTREIEPGQRGVVVGTEPNNLDKNHYANFSHSIYSPQASFFALKIPQKEGLLRLSYPPGGYQTPEEMSLSYQTRNMKKPLELTASQSKQIRSGDKVIVRTTSKGKRLEHQFQIT